MLKAVLFDLDGTLANSGPIITSMISQTMRELAGVDQPDAAYRRYVGPPLNESFAHMGVAEAEIESYIDHYRAAYAQVHHMTPAFDGMEELLAAVRERGLAVGLATSKLQALAEEVVGNLGLTDYFDTLCGCHPEEVHLGKAAVVATALDQLAQAGHLGEGAGEPSVGEPSAGEPSSGVQWRDDVVMVGDRIYDIEGAQQYGVRTILVTWGDTWPDEVALAWKTAATPAELLDILGNLSNS
ncbi:phosphoglycolate phosphatase [Trueperella bonasi]|uniref:Phosphoglycolate phosphatase n=1 Tax=Trueperella bonasi TaxID=312286 RepID=A0ABT9NI46_9ACTO|nr:HAD hydrolase-like protein [Trueperella bonasi]MDP9807069.1 phosphoglycolate phosphatase [Trueperella bonasi]